MRRIALFALLLLPALAFAQAAYVSDTGIQGGATNTGVTINNFATGTQTNPCVFAAVMYGDGSANDATVTIGGVSATDLGRVPTPLDIQGIHLFVRTGVTGTVNIVSSHSSAEAWLVGVLVSNCHQTTPVRGSVVHDSGVLGAATPVDVDVSSAVGDLVLSWATWNSRTGISPGDTLIASDEASDFKGVSRAAGASTVTMDWAGTTGAATEARILAVSVQPAPASSSAVPIIIQQM